MAFVSGHTTEIKLDNAAGTPTDISAAVDSISGFDLATASLDVTSFGNTATAFMLGLDQSPQVSISGSFDPTVYATLVAARATKTAKTLKVSFGGGGTGTPYLQAEGLITSLAPSATAGDKVTYSMTIQVTGGVTTGTN
jgi:hypothetical protein